MFDIGIGEMIALGVLGLLIFGPERLPRAAADAAKWLRQIRQMGMTARKDLTESSGLDLQDTINTVKSFGEYHPRNLATSLFAEDPGTDETKPATDKEKPAFDPDAT
ncbi:MAG: twin-arginine translocase TatA/TatE family subunit [Candidatus Nanopelagicales bacterium]|nr:twin-arginine translocase TatA/TatE family subunit [Actinomycetes bacterium]MCH9830808.1 twin-arginine translocase TatA/TatE family subunit [Actinomycetes bacterium]MCH9839449.1 twin-arginine translocase TatA/TatE family subunit [Actinomycetes bacterium]